MNPNLGRPDVGLSSAGQRRSTSTLQQCSPQSRPPADWCSSKAVTPEALEALDQAIRMLSVRHRRIPLDRARDLADLASPCCYAGVLHMVSGRLAAAQRDTAAAEAAARQAGRPGVVLMARHNLGYVRFLAGALPEALDAMATATEMAPGGHAGCAIALDRAKVLMSAGLLAEAAEFVDEATWALRANRAMPDLAEACLVKGRDTATGVGTVLVPACSLGGLSGYINTVAMCRRR